MSLAIGLHEGVPHAEYMGDPCERPSLSASIAGILLNQSADHARNAHPRLVANPTEEEAPEEEEKDVGGYKTRGTLIHALVLGGGLEFEVVQKTDAKTGEVTEAGDYKTKSAQEHKASILAAGRLPIIGAKLAKARLVADAVVARVTLPKMREVTAVWESGGVLCRGRMDALDMPQIFDLKTCENALRAATGNHVLDFGLHVQEASYTDALETLYPDLRGRVPPMQFIFQEVKKPFGFLVRTLDAELREEGHRAWSEAKRIWGQCLASGEWRSYDTKVEAIAAPPKLAFIQQDRMVRNFQSSDSVDF